MQLVRYQQDLSFLTFRARTFPSMPSIDSLNVMSLVVFPINSHVPLSCLVTLTYLHLWCRPSDDTTAKYKNLTIST